MEELTIEQKARRYDEAIERANSLLSSNQLGNAWIYKLLPELKESEDERIRKGIIYGLNYLERELSWDFLDNVDILDAYAWLEKQREKKYIISDDALREGITHFGITQYQIDNWLKKYVDVEKQGEQKHTDKVEPKFHKGEWVVIKQ
jgi:hypothetical protein